MTEAALQFTVERLLARYAAALDSGRLEEWPLFFAETCRYHITTRESHERGLPIGIFFADSRAMLVDRVLSLREANVYEPQSYRHILSPSLVLDETQDIVAVETNFLVIRTMHDGATALFSSGRYLDRIALAGDESVFTEKLVLCDSRRVDTLLAIPL
jgi:anthranilate 1,2-dioxygenase small subunit